MNRSLLGTAAALALALPGLAQAQTSASPYTSATRYDAMGRVVGTIAPDPDGSGSLHFAATRTTFDDAGRVTRVEMGELSAWQSESVDPASWSGFTAFTKVETSYDALDRKTLETGYGWDSGTSAWVASNATQYSYDGFGRLDCTAVRMNTAVYGSLPSSACTASTAGSYGGDRITRNSYDAAGQLLKVQKAYGTTRQEDYATYTYTTNGKVDTMTDANGNKASMTYDGFDRQTQWNFPSKTTAGSVSTTDYEAYTYDADANRTSLRKRDGSVINYSYDALGRMTLKDIPGGTAADVYYGYDLRGLQTYARFVSTSGAGITNTYDGFGRLTATTNDMGSTAKTLTYEWDADSKRTKITHPDSTGSAPRYFTYSYDGLDRNVAILENGSTTIVSEAFDNQGRRSSETRGAVTTSYAYDTASRLKTLSDDLASTTNDVTSGFAYSPANQLVSKSRSNDLYAFTGYTTLSRSYTVNGLNQYGTAGSASFTYDANGNLTGDGTNSYTYDVENRMVTSSASPATTLQYDTMGRLWRIVTSTKTIEFVYDGDALVYELNGSLVGRYVHGDRADDPLIWYNGSGLTDRRSLQADAQGTIVSVADSSGASLAINTYDEYGIYGTAPYGRFAYTGQAFIAQLGMYYYKARMYSPTLGRFLQTDPIGYKDQNNLYAYVGNDPTNRRDPTGEQLSANGTAIDKKLFSFEAYRLTGLKIVIAKDNTISVSSNRDKTTGSAVAASALKEAISSPASISMNLVNNDGRVDIDSFATNDVDIADINTFANIDPRLGAGALTHMLEERLYSATHNALYDESHKYALLAESRVFGGITRTDQIGSVTITTSYKGLNGKYDTMFMIARDPDGTFR